VPRYDASRAVCVVRTFKEGLLSAVAHDLELRVERFEVEVTGTAEAPVVPAVTGRFDPASLKVLHAMRDGRPNPVALSDHDKRKIEENAADDVLDVRRYPSIEFVSSSVARVGASGGNGWRVAGRLTLHGRTRDIDFTTHVEGGRQVAEVRLHQPDFGIKPYSAMLGTLKIKPDIVVRVELPEEP